MSKLSASFTICLSSDLEVAEIRQDEECSSEEDDSSEEECDTFKSQHEFRFVFRLKSIELRAIEDSNCFADSYEKIDIAHQIAQRVASRASSRCVSRSTSPEPNAVFSTSSCLIDVFKWLPFKERCKCERVCRTWRTAVIEVNHSRQTSLGLFGGHLDKIQNFCPQPTHRVHEHMDCLDIDYKTDLQAILSKVPNLKSLHIRCEASTVFRKRGDPESIGRLCPQLEHLSFVDDMNGVDIYDEMMKIFSTCSTLRHLQLRFPCKASSMVDQLALESVIVKRALYAYNRNLEILSVNVPLNVETCSILTNYCKLRKLSLHGTTIPLQGLTMLLKEGDVRGKYLRCLSIVIDSTEQLQIICSNMICLQSFHCVVNNEAKKMKSMKSIALIGQLKNLKNLFLSCWTDQAIDDGLIGILMGCQQLTSLTINADCSDTAIKYIGNFCPFIERLEINNAQPNLISDTSIELSIVNLQFLRFLTLYYCDITDDAIETLLEYSTGLEYLSITYSCRLTERTLYLIRQCAEKRPSERFMAIMPRSLARMRHLISPCPRNLNLTFYK